MPADYAESPGQQQAGPAAFAPFPADATYFGRAHIAIDPERYPNGRCARLLDPDGNPTELWEPAGTDA